MTIYDMVTKLIGPTRAIGEINEDYRRLENLTELTVLTDQLLADIERSARDADRDEASMKKVGQKAKRFLDEMRKAIEETPDATR